MADKKKKEESKSEQPNTYEEFSAQLQPPKPDTNWSVNPPTVKTDDTNTPVAVDKDGKVVKGAPFSA